MTYDRREPYSRQQYSFLKYCKYTCKGIDNTCDMYTALDPKDLCTWYKTYEHDLEKIKAGQTEHLTFPIIIKIEEDLEGIINGKDSHRISE